MLGRKDYSQEEVDHARGVVTEQVARYKALVAVAGTKADRALAAFESPFFNNLTPTLADVPARTGARHERR